MQQLEDLRQDKDRLTEWADELRVKSTDVQLHDINHNTSHADDKFSQLQHAITDRHLLILL